MDGWMDGWRLATTTTLLPMGMKPNGILLDDDDDDDDDDGVVVPSFPPSFNREVV